MQNNMFQAPTAPNNYSAMNNTSPMDNMGRFGDNQMVHAQSGEMIVPQSVLQENPQLGMGIAKALTDQGVNPYRQVVGSEYGSVNPMTGQQEFFDLGKLIKTIAPIAISAYLGPAAGAGIGSMFGAGSTAASFMSNPLVSRAITGALTSKLTGGSNKDALKNALLSGVTGAAFDSFSGAGAGTSPGTQSYGNQQVGRMNPSDVEGMGNTSFQPSGSTTTDAINQSVQSSFKPKTMSGELLQAAGVGNDNILSKILNTNMGEGLSAGLIAQLLSEGDEEEDTRSEFERRPFGQGYGGGKMGGITYKNMGGEMAFPRRNGGIDPNEGSGRKDDVPAMLMAGEFVLTKDAIKGLGNGNQRKGIQKAYDMMNNLEARA